MHNRRRKTVAVVLVATGVLGLGAASAAQLALGTSTLGAGSTAVAACQTDPIGVTFEAGLDQGVYVVTQVGLDEVTAQCVGQHVRVTLLDGTGRELGSEAVGVIAEPGRTTFDLAAVAPASAVEQVAVVVHG